MTPSCDAIYFISSFDIILNKNLKSILLITLLNEFEWQTLLLKSKKTEKRSHLKQLEHYLNLIFAFWKKKISK